MGAKLTARQARRIALSAQGLADPRPTGPVTGRRLRTLIGVLGAVQIDSVNVLARTHYLPAFSRLGAYPRELLEAQAWGKKPTLFEYWGHEASLMPVALQPLFRWRMARARAGETWTGLARFGRERRDYIDEVLARIAREGPLTGGDFADGPRQAGWWSWSNGKAALEWLFWAGFTTTRTRRGFERVYDLTERVLPRAVIEAPTPSETEAHRELLKIAARALGVATEGDLRDYFRMPVAGTRARLAEMVEAGEVEAVRVEDWRQPAFLAPGARLPRRARAAALLSPFDNLIWRRERAERLFGTRIRLEIYTPAHKRQYGYYVLPFLLGEAIAARVDLKADRQAGALRVQAAHLEAGAVAEETAPALAAELTTMAGWLGLSTVAVGGRGDLAPTLLLSLREKVARSAG
ncbi:MAG: winged helix-turn-helix domain-containing protein [Caulobacteraceae bacterium]